MPTRVLDRGQFADGAVRTDLSMGIMSELQHTERLMAYREYWAFYKGHHWSYTRGNDQPFVTANFSRRFVTVSSGWLFKRGFEVNIPDDLKTEEVPDAEERDFISRALNLTWQANGLRQWGIEAGQMGAVTGDLFLRPSWEVNNELEDPFVRVDILPAHYVFPEFGGPDGLDHKRMTEVTILFPRYVTEERGLIVKREERRVVMDGERWTPEVWQTIQDDQVVKEERNPYGEIPIVHAPNMLLAGEFYGVSDLADLVELQRLYNEKMTDVSDVIEYHGSPVTVCEGQSIKNLERGPNQMWGIKKGAKLYNLELKGELEATHKFLDRVERLMSMLSGVPREALGDIQNAANTSAVALAMRFMPLTDQRDMKEATYGLALRRINRLILKTLQIQDAPFRAKWLALKKKRPTANLYRNEVVFNEPMPRDELIDLQVSKEKLSAGLSSQEWEMEEIGRSKEEIKQIQQQQLQEAQRQAIGEFGMGAFTTDGGVPPQGAGRDLQASVTAGAQAPKPLPLPSA